MADEGKSYRNFRRILLGFHNPRNVQKQRVIFETKTFHVALLNIKVPKEGILCVE